MAYRLGLAGGGSARGSRFGLHHGIGNRPPRRPGPTGEGAAACALTTCAPDGSDPSVASCPVAVSTEVGPSARGWCQGPSEFRTQLEVTSERRSGSAQPVRGYQSTVDILVIVLLVVAAVLFGLALVNVPARVNLVAGGLLAWVLSVLIPAIAAH